LSEEFRRSIFRNSTYHLLAINVNDRRPGIVIDSKKRNKNRSLTQLFGCNRFNIQNLDKISPEGKWCIKAVIECFLLHSSLKIETEYLSPLLKERDSSQPNLKFVLSVLIQLTAAKSQRFSCLPSFFIRVYIICRPGKTIIHAFNNHIFLCIVDTFICDVNPPV